MNGSETFSPVDDPNTTQKRKHEDGAPQPRAKRNRYISIACNECKRRKIKCNGQTPCQRCGNLSLQCLYAPNCCNNFKETDEFKQMTAHISSLQEQVEQLFSNLNSLRTQGDATSTGSMGTPYHVQDYTRSMSLNQPSGVPLSPVRRKSFSKHPRFHGPTSTAFNLGVAKSSLQTMGITGPEEGLDEGAGTHHATPTESPPTEHTIVPKPTLHAEKDPIWSLTKHEAIRLVRMWHEEMGMMYPFLDIETVIRYAEMLFSFVEAAARTGLMQGARAGADAIMDPQTTILKLILAIALVLEGCGKDPLGEKLFENVQSVVEKTLLDPVEIKGINMLSLTAIYYFQRDDEALAWRIIGLAARQCLELGLHRRETYSAIFTDAKEHSQAVRTFWSVYVLDRRWSFGTGMPFTLQDPDIDPNLPKPDDSTPYLTAMISYSNIGAKVWKSIANQDAAHNNINKEDISYLDFQILSWLRAIPESLKFVHPESGRKADPPSRGIHRLQVALYLRANQMRILIYRPVLHTATSIMENLESANTVVVVAKDTIRILTYINQTSNLYRTQQTLFNYFLISALAVLFLAVAHAPAEFSSQCRDEFYMALDLVRGLSANSYVSKRLWKTIRVLKEVGPRLGLNVRTAAGDTADAHSTAVVAMAGLAGHQVDEMAVFSSGRSGNLNSPHGMASDLTTLFEAAGAYTNVISNGYPISTTEMPNGELTAAFGQEDELSRIMRDLF
ncbi:fungal-specific transcription factor-like protein [Delitschia confertaspora ATCC 74209]|uniref:Fungal-specific transcription factor-like protein n=1 Tax=Delitschia confertaspora ATCC 74209 TaxID=1513339 RepID=A0A9P4JLE6_9PLEO|nr:fungal-specific transcription factor-like protein [Delitschia confertaspora ATCC 74209]